MVIGSDPVPYPEEELVLSIRYHILQGVHLCDLYAAAAKEAGNERLETYFRDLRDRYEEWSRESGDLYFGPAIGRRSPRY
ncbi:MAG TPA: hypothetical protein VHF27_11210 [Acidimicrobiales bacterium]|nr:hypothetical protein [Acidimicrobiales bacterium]